MFADWVAAARHAELPIPDTDAANRAEKTVVGERRALASQKWRNNPLYAKKDLAAPFFQPVRRTSRNARNVKLVNVT